jgi:alpha-N-arabinofuranosidase
LLATGAELNSFKKWNSALLSKAGHNLRFITTHLVADLDEMVDRKKDHDGIIAADIALPVGVSRAIGNLRTQIGAASERIQVAYSEWLFRSPEASSLPNFDNMGGAIIAAAWLNMLALNADWIPMANMTGLVEFAGIYKRRGRPYVTPQYWALLLYAKYAGDTVIGTETQVAQYDVHGGQPFAPEITGVPLLDVLGTVNSSTGDVVLFVVNRNLKASQATSIHLNDFTAAGDVKVVTLGAASLLDKNDEEHQNAVRPLESHAHVQDATLHHVFPPGSVTVFLFSRAKQ